MMDIGINILLNNGDMMMFQDRHNWSHVFHYRHCLVNNWRNSVNRGGSLRYYSIETMDRISSVIYCSDGAISFHERILSFDNVSVTFFVLGFYVARGVISDAIVESVLWMVLEEKSGGF